VLQCNAVDFSDTTLVESPVVCCSVLQCVAVCCSVLQCNAVEFSDTTLVESPESPSSRHNKVSQQRAFDVCGNTHIHTRRKPRKDRGT